MPIIDFIIINIPVWTFFLLTIISLIIGINVTDIGRIIIFILGWQSLCGGIMLLIDYKRKKKIYFTILQYNNMKKIRKLVVPLKNTICGMALSIAIIQRAKLTGL